MRRFKNVLFVADSNGNGVAGIERAAALAVENDANLSIVRVVESIPQELQFGVVAVTPSELLETVVDEAAAAVETLADHARSVGAHRTETEVLTGREFLEVIRRVIRDGHDLVIKSAAGRSAVFDRLFSSSDMHLLRKCPCPVWMVKPVARTRFRHVLAAVDYDPSAELVDSLNRSIVELAYALAAGNDATLHLAHAWRLPHEGFFRSPRSGLDPATVDRLVDEEHRERQVWLREVLGWAADSSGNAPAPSASIKHLSRGDPRVEIPALVEDIGIDIVVMGTVGRVGIPGFFIGNTAEDILEQVECSVLAVKPDGFVSPVSAA